MPYRTRTMRNRRGIEQRKQQNTAIAMGVVVVIIWSITFLV